MIDKLEVKAFAATIAVAAVGAGAAVAATHGGGSSASTTSTIPAAAGRPSSAPRGPAGGFDTDLAAAASYLGTTKAKLQVELRAGKTLAQIASATSGKSRAGLIEAIVGAEAKQPRTAQSAGKLTQAQLNRMLSGLTTRVGNLVSGKRPPGRPQTPPTATTKK